MKRRIALVAAVVVGCALAMTGCSSSSGGSSTAASQTVMDARGFADFVRRVTEAQNAMYQQVSDATAQGLASGNLDASGWTALADDAKGVNANYAKISAPAGVQDALSAMVAANTTAEANFRALSTMTPSTASVLLQEHGGEHLGAWVEELTAFNRAAESLALG